MWEHSKMWQKHKVSTCCYKNDSNRTHFMQGHHELGLLNTHTHTHTHTHTISAKCAKGKSLKLPSFNFFCLPSYFDFLLLVLKLYILFINILNCIIFESVPRVNPFPQTKKGLSLHILPTCFYLEHITITLHNEPK